MNDPELKSSNEVYVDGDLLRVVYHGKLDETAAMDVFERIQTCAQKLKSAGLKIRILADIRDLGKHELGVRGTGLKIRETIPFVKMAIITSSDDPYSKKISEVVTERSSRKKYIQYFDDEARAITWLHRRQWRP